MPKIIREKDGKIMELSDKAYNELRKSRLDGFRDYKDEKPISIKSSVKEDIEEIEPMIEEVKVTKTKNKKQ